MCIDCADSSFSRLTNLNGRLWGEGSLLDKVSLILGTKHNNIIGNQMINKARLHEWVDGGHIKNATKQTHIRRYIKETCFSQPTTFLRPDIASEGSGRLAAPESTRSPHFDRSAA